MGSLVRWKDKFSILDRGGTFTVGGQNTIHSFTLPKRLSPQISCFSIMQPYPGRFIPEVGQAALLTLHLTQGEQKREGAGEGPRRHVSCLHRDSRRLPFIRAGLASSWYPGEAASDSFPAPQPACPPGLRSYKHQPVLRGASTEHPPLIPDGEETFWRNKC